MTENEKEFWLNLRFSITKTGKFNAYCDWVEPKAYYLNTPISIVKGEIGFLTPEMDEFDFVLTIPNQSEDLTEIDWKSLSKLQLDKENLNLIGETIEISLTGTVVL